METTYMSIHNLSPAANILFASESILDILGYQPFEVIGKSCYEYFHKDDVPFNRYRHNDAIELDKAAVIHYARIRAKSGEWVSCECVFTVVHNVLVACTSIYKDMLKHMKRDAEVKTVNRLFSSPPRDPRYYMLDHLRPKFTIAPRAHMMEPRAALILNRFSRTLNIMYATDSITDILGIPPDQIQGKSLYECMQENCIPDAIRCMESAKANDSIAYLRFFYRDPRPEAERQLQERGRSHSSDSDDGGVPLVGYEGGNARRYMEGVEQNPGTGIPHPATGDTRTDSGQSPDQDSDTRMTSLSHPGTSESRSSGRSDPMSGALLGNQEPQLRRSASRPADPIEVEVVISCTSDGLVVILRRAAQPQVVQDHGQYHGVFAAPWAAKPILPQHEAQQAQVVHNHDFMGAIQGLAVFAWALTGINGNIASYSRGTPRGEAVPQTGFPIYQPQAQIPNELGPENQAMKKWSQWTERPQNHSWYQTSHPQYMPIDQGITNPMQNNGHTLFPSNCHQTHSYGSGGYQNGQQTGQHQTQVSRQNGDGYTAYQYPLQQPPAYSYHPPTTVSQGQAAVDTTPVTGPPITGPPATGPDTKTALDGHSMKDLWR